MCVLTKIYDMCWQKKNKWKKNCENSAFEVSKYIEIIAGERKGSQLFIIYKGLAAVLDVH